MEYRYWKPLISKLYRVMFRFWCRPKLSANTNSQRVFATYQKTTSCSEVHSARSTAGSYGFDWIDEVSLGTCGLQVEFSYGLNGASYATYTGATSGNLYAEVNSNYNDPASWGARETLIVVV